MKKIKVVVAGPRGRMGREAVNMILAVPNFQLVAAVDYKYGGQDLAFMSNIPVYENCERCFADLSVDVLVDFTTPTVGKMNAETALKHKVHPVVGTTGFSSAAIDELRDLAEANQTGAIIAPNFAIGAILMMEFAKTAAKYFPDVEIIEYHHDRKLDAPSGTAIKTAELIANERQRKSQGDPDEKEFLAGARGADFDGMKIHSIRLPGLLAHQQVLFGGTGETLSIRHDSLDHSSFMTGVQMAIDKVMKLDTLIYGLENILD